MYQLIEGKVIGWSQGRMEFGPRALGARSILADPRRPEMQSRINALTTDFVNRDDPAQRAGLERDRQKAVGELSRLKQQVEDGRKAIADLEEEARRAGVPPGWLR